MQQIKSTKSSIAIYYLKNTFKNKVYKMNDEHSHKYFATDIHNTIHERIKMYGFKIVDTGKSHTHRVNGKLAEFSNEV